MFNITLGKVYHCYFIKSINIIHDLKNVQIQQIIYDIPISPIK